MSRGKQRPPPWIDKSRKDLASVRRRLRTIGLEGRKDIRRGLEKIKAADALDKEAAYMEGIVGRDYNESAFSDELVQTTGAMLGRTIGFLDEETSRLAGIAAVAGVAGQQMHDQFLGAFPASDTASASGVFIAAAVQTRLYSIDASLRGVPSIPPPDRIQSRREVFDRLRAFLANIDNRFVTMLEGSENALQSESPDHLAQAAHSMRDLYEQTIERLAPDDAVTRQPWFQRTPEARGGVSRRSRLKFILLGPVTTVDESLLAQLDEATGAAKDILDLCISRAHDHDPSLTDEEARLAIDQARHSLLNVLLNRR